MTDDLLGQIQALQFTDRRAAETLLVPFIRENFPLDVVSVALRPSAVSLNSFNGFASLSDGSRLFFKTHIEADNVIDEYYNADLLAQAGYPVLQPLYASQQAGRQFLIYPVMDCPSVFDVAWSIEEGIIPFDPRLEDAQQRTDDMLQEIYVREMRQQTAEEAAAAPIHQLFYHRLTGGRLDRFYGEGTQITWDEEGIPMSVVRQARWTINGREYPDTLDDLIKRAVHLLQPAQAGPAVVGHGDAHNGNVFFCPERTQLTYFDPAFAGRHHPLLDLTKPLFHNVFAMWMYHADYFSKRIHIRLRRSAQDWQVEHNYPLHPIREMFLKSKSERVLQPLLHDLKARGWLRDDWRSFLKSALMCCPLLTMNLTDQDKFPQEVSLLGLTMAVEMGSHARGQANLIDAVLDEFARNL